MQLQKNGKKCWLIVRSELSPKKDVPKPNKLNEIIRRCFKNDGYFMGIILTPKNEDNKDLKIYRNGEADIEMVCYEKVHSVI